MADLQSLTIDDTDFLRPASGNTAQRPGSPVVGYTRYNTDLNDMECYDGEYWIPFKNQERPIVEDGLVLRLDAGRGESYPGYGTTIFDLSGNGFDGTLTNGPTFFEDNRGYLVFDDTDDYVTINNDLDPEADGLFADASSAWSTSVWFKPNPSASDSGVIMGKGGGTGTSATFAIFMGATGFNLSVRLRGGTILVVDSTSSGWNEITVTWDGSTAKAYYNGAFNSNISVGAASLQTNSFILGAAGSGGFGYYDGYISDAKVYNRALTATEVETNFDALRDRYGV